MFLKAGDNQLKASIYSINFYMRKVFLVNVKNNNTNKTLFTLKPNAIALQIGKKTAIRDRKI